MFWIIYCRLFIRNNLWAFLYVIVSGDRLTSNNLIWCEYCNLIGWSVWCNIGYTWLPGLVLWRRQRQLKIDRKFCSVHEEITSIRLYTPCSYTRVCTTWLRLFRMNRTNNFDQSLQINSNFFCYDIEKYINFFKIRQIIGN